MSVINMCHDFRYGKVIYNNLDMYIGKSLKMYGEFSQGEADLFEQLIKPNDTIVEVGANIGSHTIHLAQLVSEGGHVYAFEPQRLVFQLLAGNIAINSLTNVHCIQACVSDNCGTTLVPVLDTSVINNWGGLSLENCEEGECVNVITLDSLNLPGCNFLKIDVEGMEIFVLKGAVNLIEQYRPIIYAEADRENKIDELYEYIKSIGYTIYRHNPPFYNPDNYFKNPENVFDNIVSFNILCIPNEKPMNLVSFERIY